MEQGEGRPHTRHPPRFTHKICKAKAARYSLLFSGGSCVLNILANVEQIIYITSTTEKGATLPSFAKKHCLISTLHFLQLVHVNFTTFF